MRVPGMAAAGLTESGRRVVYTVVGLAGGAAWWLVCRSLGRTAEWQGGHGMRHGSYVIVIALALAAVPTGLRAQAGMDTLVQARDETRALRIYSSLMSPFCPGLTVAACPSPGAEQMRQEVRRRLGAGEGEPAIVAALIATYGAEILGAPPAKRWGLALWIPPALALLLGGGALARWLRRRASPAEEDEAQAGAAAPETNRVLRARLEEELQAFGREV